MTDPIIEKIAVYMPDAEVKQFLVFQEYYEPFALMVDRGVFGQKNCAVTLHFDSKGTLQTIQRADFLYSRRHDELSTV